MSTKYKGKYKRKKEKKIKIKKDKNKILIKRLRIWKVQTYQKVKDLAINIKRAKMFYNKKIANLIYLTCLLITLDFLLIS